MSYILEALKKAESERERGQVPSVHTAPINHAMRLANGDATVPWLPWLFALAVLLALVWAYATWRPQAAEGLATPAVSSQAAPVPAVTASASAPASAPVAPAVPVVTDSVTRGRVVSVVAPAALSVTPTAAAPAAPPAARPVAPAAGLALAPPQAQAKAAPAEPIPAKVVPAASPALPEALPKPVATAPRTNAGVLPLLQELPESLRRQMPALNISGAVYSDAPPEWTLIINDQVIGKGGQIAPDLRLEEIGPSNAVFNFRGQRFRMER